MALATDRQGPVGKQAFAVARNDDLIRPCEQSEAIRLGLRICGFSLDCFAVARNDAVSASEARFLQRFVTFQGLAARKISARFRRSKFAELGPPGSARDSRRSRRAPPAPVGNPRFAP